jgi:addiction module HigA family antidote
VSVSGNWRVIFEFEGGTSPMSIWSITLSRKEVRKPMPRTHNSPHPGEVIKELCLDPLRLTATAAAEGLGVSWRTLSALLNGRAGISPDMAIRLSKGFERSPESWLQLQLKYDLWQAEQRSGAIKVKQFPTPAPR